MSTTTISLESIGIPGFFAGKSVFLTGGTGFIGKVLIEKLLRSCPDIGTIYVLAREKRGKTIEERIDHIFKLPLFDLVRKIAGARQKVRPLCGNVLELGLGLSAADCSELQENVAIVYHAAASVRFDESMRDALMKNTRATREVCRLALKMKRIEVLLHISTAYCNTDRKVIDECLYPPHADWKYAIELAEADDTARLDAVTAEFLSQLPNTYTFTKSLAEHVVNDMCGTKIPTIIVRPSIVISTIKEPFPGWIDNFNGPVGLMIAGGKGIVRSIYADPDIVADYVPVDLIVKAMLIATWQKGISKNCKEVSFYNASANRAHPVTMGQMVQLGKDLCWEVPLNNGLWYPGGGITKCRYYHYLNVVLFHLLPALIIDGILKLFGRKAILTKIQKTILTANMALEYFITNEWQFINDKSRDLETVLMPQDVAAFSYDKDNVNVYEYFRAAMLGGRRYLLKEDDSTLAQAKAHHKRLYILNWITSFIWYSMWMLVLVMKFEALTAVVLSVVLFYQILIRK